MTPEQMIGRRVAELRDRRELTQQELGELLVPYLGKAWHRQVVSLAEKGRRVFAAVELLALAKALGVTVSALLVPPMDVNEIELPSGHTLERSELERLVMDPEVRNVVPAAAAAIRRLGNWLNEVLADGTVQLKELAIEYETLTGVIGGVQTDAADARLARHVQDVPIKSAAEGSSDG